MTSKLSPQFLAVSKAGEDGLLLGVNTWQIYNDSQHCDHGTNYVANLSLSSCNDQEFTCGGHGNCVPMEQRNHQNISIFNQINSVYLLQM